jgi:hypothetical protein
MGRQAAGDRTAHGGAVGNGMDDRSRRQTRSRHRHTGFIRPRSNERRMDTFEIGGELEVDRLGFCAMRLTSYLMLGEPMIPVPPSHALLCRRTGRPDDTASTYGPGVYERLIGTSLAPYDDVGVATKGGQLRNSDGDWIPCGDPPIFEIPSSVVSTGAVSNRSICTNFTGSIRTWTSSTASRPWLNYATRAKYLTSVSHRSPSTNWRPRGNMSRSRRFRIGSTSWIGTQPRSLRPARRTTSGSSPGVRSPGESSGVSRPSRRLPCDTTR